MKVIMTKAELDRYVRAYTEDEDRGDAFITKDPSSPSGWSVYVQMNHWDLHIPITVEG